MKKTKVTIHTARLLVFALLIGLLIPFGALDAQAAANKALSMKVNFNGKTYREEVTDDDWNDNSYTMYATYKKNVKIQKGMKVSQTAYVPVSLLKKNGDQVNLCVYLDLETTKGKYVGSIWGAYSFSIRKEDKGIVLTRWNNAKEREEKAGKLASFKKSGKYYVVQIKNLTFEPNIWTENATAIKVAKYNKTCRVSQALNVVGLCAKSKNAAVYTDNLSIKSNSTQKISFDKKDYKDVWGWSAKKDKEWPVSVAKIK